MSRALKIRNAGLLAAGFVLMGPIALAIRKALESTAASVEPVIPVLLLFPTVGASLIGVANSTPQRDMEATGVQAIRTLSVVYALAMSLVLVASIAPAAFSPPWGFISSARNVFGMVGLAELTAASAGARLAWIGPLAFSTLTLAAASEGRGGWTWLFAPDSDWLALAIATALFVAGITTLALKAPLER